MLVTVWGARLTFTFARKGGYSGVEDYRWPILRARMSPAQFQVFNLLFISLYQNIIVLPALTAYEHRSTPFGALDVADRFVQSGLCEQVQWWALFLFGAIAAAASREADNGVNG